MGLKFKAKNKLRADSCKGYSMIFYNIFIVQVIFEVMSFIRKYYGQNLKNLLDIREKRRKLSINRLSTQTLPRFPRPVSESRILKTRPTSEERQTTDKKMFNKLSNQLKTIQESINLISDRRKKKNSKYKAKAITEASQEDPKHKLYKQVLSQIKEIKKTVSNPIQHSRNKSKKMSEPSDSTEKTVFYGVDYIDGIQFKIKIKLSREVYCLMAKNNHTKLLLEMDAKDYLGFHQRELSGNPCNIFKYLIIENNKLRFRNVNQIKRPQSLRSYLSSY